MIVSSYDRRNMNELKSEIEYCQRLMDSHYGPGNTPTYKSWPVEAQGLRNAMGTFLINARRLVNDLGQGKSV